MQWSEFRARMDWVTAPTGYDVDKHIASGGMGEVYLARDAAHGKVAFKFFQDLPERQAAEQSLRFDRERQLAAQLSHPNIVKVLAHGTEMGRAYLVMEFMEH